MAENMSRADLEAMARERGIENPESFKNKEELLAALNGSNGNGADNDAPSGDPRDADPAADSGAPRSTGATTNPGANVPGDMQDQDADLDEMQREINHLRIDPVTGQRLSDFDPNVTGLDDATRDMVLGGMRFGSVDARANTLQRVLDARSEQEQAAARAAEELEAAKKANKVPTQQIAYVDPATYKAREFAVVQAQAKATTTKTTIPGGRYLVNGELVNAAGDLIDDSGHVLQRRG